MESRSCAAVCGKKVLAHCSTRAEACAVSCRNHSMMASSLQGRGAQTPEKRQNVLEDLSDLGEARDLGEHWRKGWNCSLKGTY